MAEPIEIPQVDKVSIARATGQPSKARKRRSSHNAIKHGIFSDVTILPGESADQYRLLLKELWEALQPEGRLEELLVENLASLAWRHRRLLAAEGAEIRESNEFLEWDRQNQDREREEKTETFASHVEHMHDPDPGLIRKIQIPDVLDLCLKLLGELRQKLESGGFNKERDTAALKKIYGPDTDLGKTPLRSYLAWLNTAEVPQEERKRRGYATPEQCKNNFVTEIDEEISRFREYGRKRELIESEPLPLCRPPYTSTTSGGLVSKDARSRTRWAVQSKAGTVSCANGCSSARTPENAGGEIFSSCSMRSAAAATMRGYTGVASAQQEGYATLCIEKTARRAGNPVARS